MQDSLTYLGADGVFHGVMLAVNGVHCLSSFYVDHLSMKRRNMGGSDACILRPVEADVSFPYASSLLDRIGKSA